MHNGVKETLNQLRIEFWIPKVKNLILKIILKCFLCRRYEGKTYSYPDVPPLPSSRVNDDYVFKYTGIDYEGCEDSLAN